MQSGDPKTAETLARQAATVFSAQKAEDDETMALAVVAESLLLQGRPAEARDAVARARTLAQRTQNRLVRFAMGISRARVDAASGKTADARTLLESVSQEATPLGFRGYELQARYALGELELSHGDRAAGRVRLAALATDAERFGYEAIAQAAGKALAP